MINSGNHGSTGNIMLRIADVARKEGHIVYTACPDGRSMRKKKLENHIYIGNKIGRNLHIELNLFTGLHGMFSIIDTKCFLKKLDRINPEVIHFHNLHSCYINLPMLFGYIKKHHIRVVWTLHDCWAFTGQCPHFTMVKCDKWKTGCHNCTQINVYPASRVDRTRTMWKLKKKWFTGINDMTIVTPSQWLANLVKQSYLRYYPVKVINNGINLDIFKPTESDFRCKYHLEDKYILLGVAFDWGKRKGLDVFIELSKRLDERFQIVVVGTNDEVDRKLPSNIISIHRTSNQKELAEIYTAADLFVNPTREEVLGLVNVESLACGTPVITFNTGGSPECIDEKSGCVIDVDDVDTLEREIVRICNNHIFQSEDCLKRAKLFNSTIKYADYTSLYV